MEGSAGMLKSLSGRLPDAGTVQYAPDGQNTSVATIVESLFPTVQKLLAEDETFFFVAYSYGALVALEMVHVLESRGYKGTLICVDGAPLFRKSLVNSINAESKRRLLVDLICQLLSFFVPHDEIARNKDTPIRRENYGKHYSDISKDEVLREIEASTRNVSDIEADSVILRVGEAAVDEEEEVSVIALFGSGNEDYLVEFLMGIGRLYVNGHDPQIDRLYPEVDLPVGRGTPMISPYVRWNHSREMFVPQYHLDFTRQSKRGIRRYSIETSDRRWAFITGHSVDGKNLFPATGYLYMVWETYSIVRGVPLDVSRVSLRNCRFIRTTSVPSKGSVVFTVSITTGTGDFEVVEGNSTVAAGTIGLLPDGEANIRSIRSPDLRESRGLRMDKRDVYKELRLRGYHYSGEFQAIENYNFVASTGYLKWTENWIAFLDNMLQLKAFQTDSRSLQVPTFISRVDVAADSHLDLIEATIKDSEVKTPNLPVYVDRSTGDVTCGGITISGAIISPITRRKILETPSLESHQFVPNIAGLDLHTSISVNTQIILENSLVRKFKAVEVVDDFSDDSLEPLMPLIKPHLSHEGVVGQPAVRILSATPLEVDVDVGKGKLEDETECLLVIVSKSLRRPEILRSAFGALKENGFVISRESPGCDVKSDLYPGATIVTTHRTPSETIFLLRQRSQRPEARYIEVDSSEDFSWLPEVQHVLNGNPPQDLVLYSRDPTSGVLGMVTCLKKEHPNGNVRCVFLMDEGEEFDANRKIYANQLEKNLAFNVYRNGQWGTVRRLPLEESNAVASGHCFVDIASRGDLSSLVWIGGALAHRTVPGPEQQLIYVYYAGINFRDVMLATGKISVDLDYFKGEALLGLEFSGRDSRGKRVMGWCAGGSFSNLLLADGDLVYEVPREWTMEEAATVPMVYTTAVYALITCGRMRRGESVLIHSGAGGVGQAALNLALHYGCEVFTTVGTLGKRGFLKKTYPQLKDGNIGNSHDESFEQMVLERTNGRGVDMVLNSLTGEKLVASVRCLALGGRFLEIGKFDLANNVHLRLELLKRRASFHGVMLDKIFVDPKRCGIRKIFEGLVREGAVRPLNGSVFKREEVEQAFRFMATGRHTGKVLIRVREPEEQLVVSPAEQTLRGLARYRCDHQMAYVIAGGLGGFGLELADWLVLRGARKLVLASRKGISNGYQRYRIGLWESYGAVVKISTAPLATREGCERLIEEGLGLGRVASVFNLAVVLDDAVFENQTPESFRNAFAPKVAVTRHLDEVTRTKCPDLRDFVVFSSVVARKGHAGQTNYGMANSVAERICERRKREGYPALAIQWGLVGEVGIVAETLNKTEIEGLVQQPISSCLRVLDTLFTQRGAVVVSSVVVAQQRESQSSEDIVDAILNIIGVRDSKYVSAHSTLAELGMDSMLAIEIKVALERDFEIFLSAREMRSTTLARLKELQEEKTGARSDNDTKRESNLGTERILSISSEDLGGNTSSVVPELDEKSTFPKAVLFPGIEGFAGVLKSLSGRLPDVRTVQYVPDGQNTSVATIVESLFPTVQKLLAEDESFFFVAYSYGALIALKMVHVLESRGYTGTLICVDGAPLFSKSLANSLNAESKRRLLIGLICQLLSFFVPHDEIARNKAVIAECETWQGSIKRAAELAKNHNASKAYHVKRLAETVYLRHLDLDTYRPAYAHLKSDVKLFRPTLSAMQDIEEDYGLSQFFRKPVEIRYFEGNHQTVLENEKLAEAINLAMRESTRRM